MLAEFWIHIVFVAVLTFAAGGALWLLNKRILPLDLAEADAATVQPVFLGLIRRPLMVFIGLAWLYLCVELVPWDILITISDEDKLGKIESYRQLFWEVIWSLSLSWGCLSVLREWELSLAVKKESTVVKAWGASMIYIIMALKFLVYVLLGLTLLRVFDLGTLADNIFTTGALSTVIIGLAAREALANIFGGLLVHFDRPFVVGDYIMSSDKNIEGTVEKIGWRITEVRTPLRVLKFIPNSLFSTITLENLTRRSHRRIRLDVGIRYQDYDKVKVICQSLSDYCKDWKQVDSRQSDFITFQSLGDYALGIRVNVFTKPLSYRDYNLALDTLLHQIVQTVHQSGADFPFPTTTLDAEEVVRVLKANQPDLQADSKS